MMKILQKLIIIIIIISILMYSTRVFATSLNDLENEKSSVKEQISDKEEELEEIEGEKTEAIKQVSKLIAQISSYQSEIDDLNDKIEELKDKIDEITKQIKVDEEEYEKQQKTLNARLVAMYKNGNTSYLDFLLSSNNIVDFISSYYLISQMTEYDEKMLKEVADHKAKIEKQKEDLERDKKEVENSQKAVVSKQNALQVVKREKQSYADKLTDKEKETERKIQELQDANDELDRKIKKAKAEIEAAKAAASRVSGGSKPTGNPSSYGLTWPISMPGMYLSAGWYYSTGRLHGATDITGAGIYGQPIYAASSGYVIVSEAKINSSGNYYSYGNYVMIAHYNGLYTLYGHMSKRAVSAGQTVTQGQIIGYVGSTGNSSGPHLHFEVRTGNGTYSERVNPIYYLPSR